MEKKWEMAAIQSALVYASFRYGCELVLTAAIVHRKRYRERYVKLSEETAKAAAALKRKKSKSLQFNSKVDIQSYNRE